MSPVKILLIEDDRRLAEHTAEYLRGHEATVDIVEDGEAGLKAAQSGSYDIVLLDIMLPVLDGLELCKQLRKSSQVPVIMLTARDDEIDRVLGLEIGADDYVNKPFSPRELLARIRAILRRQQGVALPEDACLSVGPVTIDRDRRVVRVNDTTIDLTAYQFDLLWVLARKSGRVLPRTELYKQVRALRGEPPTDFDPSVDRSIDVHLSKIRSALAAVDSDAAQMVRTIRGVGYVFGGDE